MEEFIGTIIGLVIVICIFAWLLGVLAGAFFLLLQILLYTSPAYIIAGAVMFIILEVFKSKMNRQVSLFLIKNINALYDKGSLSWSIEDGLIKSYSLSWHAATQTIIAAAGVTIGFIVFFILSAKGWFARLTFLYLWEDRGPINIHPDIGFALGFIVSAITVIAITFLLNPSESPEILLRQKADELVSRINTSLKRTHELNPLEESIKSINAKLGTSFPVDFKSEIQKFVDAHKQELLSDVTRLNDLISEIIKRAKEDVAQLEKADNLYDLARKFYTETVREVNKTGSSPALLTHLDYIHTYLHSENLKDVLQRKNWNDFHEIVNGILKELTEVKEAAVGILSPEETEEEKSCRILGVPPNATADQIKKMYKALAAVWHPDSNTVKDDNRMKEINSAYDFLMKLRN